MLRLLQSEVEDALITLHGDVSKARRAHQRKAEAAQRLANTAEEWTGKAKVAVDHGREDLARAALLARESDRQKVEDMKAESRHSPIKSPKWTEPSRSLRPSATMSESGSRKSRLAVSHRVRRRP